MRRLFCLAVLLLGCNKSTTVNQYSGPPTEEPSEPPPEGEGGQGSGGQVDSGGAGGSVASGGTAPAAGSSAGGTPSGGGAAGGASTPKKYVPEVYFEGNEACTNCIHSMSSTGCTNIAGCLSTVVNTTTDGCQKGKACLDKNRGEGASWSCSLDICLTNFDGQTQKFWECVTDNCSTPCGVNKVPGSSPPWGCP